MSSKLSGLTLGAALAALLPAAAHAQIHVGIVVSETGPAAALGIPQKNTVAQLPKEIDGQTSNTPLLDDATDPTKAVADARKLVAENNIDFLIGSSATPSTLALVDVAAETKTPYCAMVPTKATVSPLDDKRRWVFKAPQDDAIMAAAVFDHMKANGVKTIAFLGYTDGYGEGWLTAAKAAAKARGIDIVDVERFQRTDTSVDAQALKILSSNPDAVLIAASGTVAVMPQKALKELGYAKPIYQTHGVSTMEFVRVGGKDVEGTVFPGGAGRGGEPPARQPPEQGGRPRLHQGLRGQQQDAVRRLRRASGRLRRDHARRGQGRAREGQARHAGVPRRAARRGRDRRTSSPPTTASTPIRRPTTPASTSARAC